MQSPKSKRGHSPGESPSSYDPPEKKQEGVGEQQTGHKTTKVPKHSPTGHHGSPQQSGPSSVPTHPETPSQAGRAGYAESEDAKRKGGNVSRFGGGE